MLVIMVYIFQVPIQGSLALLLALACLFLLCSLGLGLLVSTVAETQLAAMQFAFVIMLPSVLLSGFMFREEMPWLIQTITYAIPVTYFIQILRGVVLRSAGFWVCGHPFPGAVDLCDRRAGGQRPAFPQATGLIALVGCVQKMASTAATTHMIAPITSLHGPSGVPKRPLVRS